VRNFHFPGRSSVHARHGVAATAQPLASLAAVDMLRRGGSAADGAIAAAAVLAVVEPMATGIGGDAFCLVATKDGVEGYNGSGRAPAALTLDHVADSGLARIPVDSPHAVTVPGAVDCWMSLLERHGKLDRTIVLAPAIDYAMNGFAVTPRIAYEWRLGMPKLSKNAHAAKHLLPGGQAPKAARVFRSPALGRTLTEIAKHGRAGFYEGWAADDMAASLKALGGTHTSADFAKHKGNWVTPVHSKYRGVDVFEIPPNGQGVTTLLILNILENFAIGDYQPLSPMRFHLEAEATRLAYMERDRCIADPENAKVDVAHFTDKAFARELAATIDLTRPGAGAPAAREGDTTYLAVADDTGLMVSFINSIYHGFGSGLASAESGVLFQNRGHGFALDPKHPNAVAGGKRPFHTIIPAMACKGHKPWLAFGVMGGDFQPVGQSHVLTNLIDWHMDIQEAIDCPRGFLFGGNFSLEQGVPETTRDALAAMGHTVVQAPEPLGGGQGVMRDFDSETWIAGSDPRKDGCALGY
jgi:gamma-glutamyltranspeptidase/glutathione hydrolase